MSGAQKGCRELVFVSECLFGVIIKGSFTCKALEGQVQEDRKLWDVEPLEGGMNYSGRNSRDVLGDLDLNVE